MEGRPALARRLLELMGRRLRRADQATQDLVFFDAPTRLARKLLELAEEHGDFIMRVQIPSLHEGHDLLVTFGSAPSEQQGTTAFLLDLYDVTAPVDPDDARSIEQRFDQAHDNIIHAFEHAITPTARTLFRETETGG